MLQGMTGFGSASCLSHGFSVCWQLKSVNHRFLDLAFRLPDGYGEFEISAARRLKAIFSRGRIECCLTIKQDQEEGVELKINSGLLHSLLELEKSVVALHPGDPAPLAMAALLSWPGMVVQEHSLQLLTNGREGEIFSQEILALLDEAAGRLQSTRQAEGVELHGVIRVLLTDLNLLVARVVEHLPRVEEAIAKRLHDRLVELSAVDIDQERMAQEQVYFMNRVDVAEELDRLQIHLKEVTKVLDYEEPVGRRLDFICQELNREANTICSKSQDGEISRIGIDMKVIVEKMREQVQNIE